jgi:hypothetical protein
MTTGAATILNAYPAGLAGIDEDALVMCLQECLNCASAATSCADACLADPDRAELARCVGTALVCADIAETTAWTVSRLSCRDAAVVRAILVACVGACRSCYDECRTHALSHEYCRICGDACHRCAHACRELAKVLPQGRSTIAG